MDQHVKLESLEKRIQTLLSENDVAIKETEDRLAEAETKLKQAEERRANAVRTGNKKSFSDAETEMREANFDLAFHRERLKALRSEPLLPESEYKALLSDVYDESLQFLDGVNARIAEILLQLKGWRNEAQKICDRTDKVVRQLQRRVMRVKAPAGTQDADFYFYYLGRGEQFLPNHAPRAGHVDPVNFVEEVLRTPVAQTILQLQREAAKAEAAKAEAAKRDGGTSADEDRD